MGRSLHWRRRLHRGRLGTERGRTLRGGRWGRQGGAEHRAAENVRRFDQSGGSGGLLAGTPFDKRLDLDDFVVFQAG